MKGMFEDSQDITWMKNSVKIMSSLSEENLEELDQMADELCQEYIAQSDDKANKNDLTALFRLGYGLYVVTSRDGEKDNGLIVNTVTQLTDNPNRVAVNINKANYSHDMIKKTGVMNVNCLSVEAPFKCLKDLDSRAEEKQINLKDGICCVQTMVLPSFQNISMPSLH